MMVVIVNSISTGRMLYCGAIETSGYNINVHGISSIGLQSQARQIALQDCPRTRLLNILSTTSNIQKEAQRVPKPDWTMFRGRAMDGATPWYMS